ncbi:MAG: sulfite exporter TauE/SafE family protein [Verrucomicrobiota bacterium]
MTSGVAGPLAALVAGLVTSLHCSGMCGPLACAACVKSNGAGSLTAAAFYHGSRIISYGVVGLLAGWIGRAVSDVLLLGTARWLTWAFVVFFVVVATGLDKRMRIPLAGAWMAKCLGSQDTAPVRATILGALTPFIPCGPLYMIVAAAALSGSALSGATVLVAFAAGTVPLMFALQSQYFRFGSRLSPLALDRVRRVLAAVSVGLLLYRGASDPTILCQ